MRRPDMSIRACTELHRAAEDLIDIFDEKFGEDRRDWPIGFAPRISRLRAAVDEYSRTGS